VLIVQVAHREVRLIIERIDEMVFRDRFIVVNGSVSIAQGFEHKAGLQLTRQVADFILATGPRSRVVRRVATRAARSSGWKRPRRML
jgi:hypothetical protein